MPSMLIRRTCACLIGAGLLVVSVGCSKDEAPAKPKVSAENKAAVPSESAIESPVQAILAKADAYDGTVDKQISKCAACSLGMDGDVAHSMKTGEYTMHFCSEGCKEHFATDTTKAILAMTVPGE